VNSLHRLGSEETIPQPFSFLNEDGLKQLPAILKLRLRGSHFAPRRIPPKTWAAEPRRPFFVSGAVRHQATALAGRAFGGIGEPIHPKAMPVILTTNEKCERLDTHALGRGQGAATADGGRRADDRRPRHGQGRQCGRVKPNDL
jgi:hypothetical protein